MYIVALSVLVIYILYIIMVRVAIANIVETHCYVKAHQRNSAIMVRVLSIKGVMRQM